MTTKQRVGWLLVSLMMGLGLVLAGLTYQSAPVATATTSFVTRSGSNFTVNGSNYRFGGTNTYYLAYKSNNTISDALTTAANNGFQVLRTWGFLDIGNQNGSNSVDGIKDGVYYQYWNGSAPAYNDGANGLQHLDYAIYRASQLNMRLIIPFVNNWSAFGGIDQYVRWRGGQYHDQFYTDSTIQGWYKNYISHLLNHVNSYSGIAYKNDPAIFAWELGNEPRCKGSGTYPTSSSCNTGTITSWATTMSGFIKANDSKHLVSVGDEGFYCGTGSDWTENCGEGIDSVALTKISSIDFMTIHLYPEDWGKSLDWGTTWITRHISDAHANGKGFLLEEFGVKDQSQRNNYDKLWTDAVINNGGNGFTYWMLAAHLDDGSLYPDYDGYTVYCPSTYCPTLSNAANQLSGGSSNPTPTATPTSGPTATPTPTPRPATPTPTPTSGGQYGIHYAVSNSWNSGYNISVDVLNKGAAAFTGWRVSFQVAHGETIANAWNATCSQSGSTITCTNVSYNATINSGSSTNFGMQLNSPGGAVSYPATFTVNGVTVQPS